MGTGSMGAGEQIVTVFGGSGFIGRYLVRRLAKLGAVVRVPSRHPGQAAFLKTSGTVGQVVPMGCDFRDDASLSRAIVGADIVINLIGILSPSGGNDFQTIHGTLAGRIAKISASAGVRRLVQMSALGADANSAANYQQSKAAGEAATLAAFPNVTIFRPSVVFGPEDDFFNRFGAMAQYAPFLPLIGGGETKFEPVYVGDVCDAVMAALARTDSMGQTYELVGPRMYTFRALMEMVKRETMRPNKRLLSLPFGLATLQAMVLERLPNPILTRDQVTMLKTHNVASGKLPGLAALGVSPTAVEVIIPTYLDKFRVGGRFTAPAPQRVG